MWARPSGLRTFEATFTFTSITARRLVVSPRETLSIGFRVLVSRHPAIQTTGLLTFAPAGLSPAEHASFRWTHNRTCGFPAYGSYSSCLRLGPPPLWGWPTSSAGKSSWVPSLRPHCQASSLLRTRPSLRARIGTRRLTGLPLGDLPWHRGDRFPRSAQEPLAGLTPSSCRCAARPVDRLPPSFVPGHQQLEPGFGDVPTLSTRRQRYRGRDARCWAPPAQIRTGPI